MSNPLCDTCRNAILAGELLNKVQRTGVYDLHFRPTSAGVTAVSLRQEYPQRGAQDIPKVLNERQTAEIRGDPKAFAKEFFADCRKPGKETPEKELQSFIIRNSYEKNRELALPGLEACRFVTDEIPFDGRCPCDLLALRVDGVGSHRPVVIELKNHRARNEIVKQLRYHSQEVERQFALVSQLCSAILGEAIDLVGPVLQVAIWPPPPSGKARPRPISETGSVIWLEYREEIKGSEKQYSFRPALEPGGKD